MRGFDSYRRIAGIAVLALLAVHPWLRPEGAWTLLAACDLAALATAVGLIAGADRIVAIAFVFQLAVGVPALVVGMLTTYHWNWSGIAVHVLPMVLGGFVVAGSGVPRRAALYAWIGYAVAFLAAAIVVPAGVDINFSDRVWAPLAPTLEPWSFRLVVLGVVGVELAIAHLVIALRKPRF